MPLLVVPPVETEIWYPAWATVKAPTDSRFPGALPLPAVALAVPAVEQAADFVELG